MSRRSPARFLAPLALIAAVLTVYLVTRPEVRTLTDTAPSTSTASRSPTSSTAAKRSTKAKKKAAKTYTVKTGDVLGSIADRTGVSVADLQDYNEIDDAQNLRVGQKLKLAP